MVMVNYQYKMTKKQKAESQRLQQASVRTTKLGLVFVAIYALSTLIFQLWKLMTPDILQQRWLIVAVTLGVTLALWWYSRSRNLSPRYYQGIIFLQILMYLAVASYSIYAERGMASNSVILFIIPLVIVALEYSGRALISTTILCSVVYAGTAIKYFKDYPSEGYKVELYGGIVFYVSIILLISALLWVLVRSKNYAK
jgi:hypothetical protein